MSKLASKTIEWLQEAEQKYLDGMPAVTDENRKRLMQIGLDAVQDELKRRKQKKSESEEQIRLKALHEKAQNEKLEPKEAEKVGNEMIDLYTKQAERERELFFQKQAQEHREKGREDLAEKVEQYIKDQYLTQESATRAFAPTIAAPRPQPERTVIIQMVKGEKEMNYSQVMSEAKRYANGLLTMKSYRAGSDIKTLDMGCNLIALYAAWVWFQDGKHPLVTDLLPQYNKYSEDNQARAERLLEQLRTELA